MAEKGGGFRFSVSAKSSITRLLPAKISVPNKELESPKMGVH